MEGRIVLVAELTDKIALARVVRAALHHEVAHVPLSDVPRGEGLYTLQLRAPGSPGVVVSAEPVGARSESGFPLLLRPLDPSHVPELNAIIDDVPPSLAPVSKRASAIFDSMPPLPVAPVKRPPHDTKAEEHERARESNPDSDDLGESVLFDPEAAIISMAPARPEGTTEDDTLTVPFRPSSPPSFRPPADKHEPSLSVEVDFEDPSVARATSDWKKTDPDARGLLDGVIVDEVVIAPDVRQTKVSEGQKNAAHPSDGDGISVVFGTEPTIPGAEASPGSEPIDIIVRKGQDATLTMPGAPVTSVHDDPDTLQRASQAMPSTIGTMSKRGPRTPKRMQVIVGANRIIANKYRIEGLIGAGAVGAVYKASHADLARTVAIKVLHPHCRSDPELMASFRKEARAASNLDHPSVTIVHDFGEEPDGLVYIVMEYLPGHTLQVILNEQQRLPAKRAIHVMLQVTAALSAAHERGIVHRDVKPDNIMLVQSRDDEGFPYELAKVCDFGIAALEAGPDPSDGEFTAGTPEYMAPEQAHGRTDVRTDIYACGIVLYEMLAGHPPFVGETVKEILYKHANEAVLRFAQMSDIQIDARLEALVLRALEKAPDRRFASMREMRQALKRLL